MLAAWILLAMTILTPAAMALALFLLADSTVDARFCGPPARNAEGVIIRSQKVLARFERLYPRPQDGRRWYKDHVLPLSCGGCDTIINLQWLPEAQWREKSAWERKVYGGRGISKGCP